MVDLLALRHKLFVLGVSVFVGLVVFLKVVHHLFDGQALALGERILAQQVQVLVLFSLKEVLLKHRVQLVPEHVEIVQLHVTHFIHLLEWSRLENISEGKSSGQQSLVETVFEATAESRHEFSVSDKVVFCYVELLHVHSLSIVCGLSPRSTCSRQHLRPICTLVLGFLFVLVSEALLVCLLERLLLDGSHDEVEVALSLAVSDLIEHDLRLHIHTSRFTDEHSLKSLQHLQDVHWIHAPILVVITQLEHQLYLLVLRHARQKVTSEQEVNYVHGIALSDTFRITTNFKRTESLEECLHEVFGRCLIWEL